MDEMDTWPTLAAIQYETTRRPVIPKFFWFILECIIFALIIVGVWIAVFIIIEAVIGISLILAWFLGLPT